MSDRHLYHFSPCVQTANGEGYLIKRIVGGPTGGNLVVNVPALEASIGQPRGIAQSQNGDVYIASSMHVVIKVELNELVQLESRVTVIVGTGKQDKGADDVLGTDCTLNSPGGISLIEDANGEVTAVLIADTNNHRIRQWDRKSQKIHTIAGTGARGSSGDGGPAKSALLNSPYHVYSDKLTGDVFIADYDKKKVRRVRGDTITTVAGECKAKDGLGDGGCLYKRTITSCDAGELFINEMSSGSGRIRKVGVDGTINTAAGGGETGDVLPNKVKLNYPTGITLSTSGELIVADFLFGIVRRQVAAMVFWRSLPVMAVTYRSWWSSHW